MSTLPESMTCRQFELPGIQDLSKEQEAARALPKHGQHLVIGGPGTGKSVLALLRAKRHAQAGEPHVFLVFNKLLHEASRCLGGEIIRCRQWMSWFLVTFRQITGRKPPHLPKDPGSGWRGIDWEKVHDIIQSNTGGTGPKADYLIIDEGQDMPPDFYKALTGLGFEHFFVVADQNQQIVAGKNSSRRDIELQLAIAPESVVELKKNFRNRAAVARFSGTFHTGDIATPRVDIPLDPGPESDLPVLFTYHENQFQALIKRILKLAGHAPSKLIGVIAPNNDVRERFFKALEHTAETMDPAGRIVFIRTYAAGHPCFARFDQGGILVINAQACKGLEFDHVFLADIDAYFIPSGDDASLKRLFYVMTARARENLTLLRSAGAVCPADNLLPQNPELMQRFP